MPPGTSTVASERSENSVAVGMLLVITTSAAVEQLLGQVVAAGRSPAR